MSKPRIGTQPRPRIININYYAAVIRPRPRWQRPLQVRLGRSATPWRLFHDGTFGGGYQDFPSWESAYTYLIQKGA